MRDIFRTTYSIEPYETGCNAVQISQKPLQPSWLESILDSEVIQWWKDVISSVRAGWHKPCLV